MSFVIEMDGKPIMWTTSFSWEDNSDVNETTTHTGVITTPAEKGNYTISIERASVNNYAEEQECYDILKKSKTEPITVVATKQTRKGINRTTCIKCIRTSFSEEYDENGDVTFSFDMNCEDVVKEFKKSS